MAEFSHDSRDAATGLLSALSLFACMHSTLRSLAISLAGTLGLCATSSLRAQLPVPLPSAVRTGIVVTSDWLQANALPMDRDAIHSMAVMASYRRSTYSVDAGWLRIARDLSTIQGGAVLVGRPLYWKSVLFTPAVGLLGGRAQASVDSTGFDFTAPDGTTGHTPRYTYSSGATFGGGASLTLTVPVYGPIGARVLAQQWFFGGTPVEGDRGRTLLGAGLSVRVK